MKDICEALFEYVSEDKDTVGIVLNYEDFAKIPASPQLGTPGYYMDPVRQREILYGGEYGCYIDPEGQRALSSNNPNEWKGPRLTIMVSRRVKPGQYITLTAKEVGERIKTNYAMRNRRNKQGVAQSG